MERSPTRQEFKERQRQFEEGLHALVSEFIRVDETNIEAISGLPHEADGIEEDIAGHFNVAVNSVWNAVNTLREEEKVSFGTRKGGPLHDPKKVLTHVALPAEPR